MPAIAILLAAVTGLGAAVGAQVRCVDAARAGARLAARGEPSGVVVAAAGRLAPSGSRISTERAGSTVRVSVTAEVGLPLSLPALSVRASAVADREQP
jgi:hypothetical protein